jgi:hypothetical protein
LTFAKGYFESRLTTFGTFLGAPLEFTLKLDGYAARTVKLGRGPFPWRNLYGQIAYQYYLLDHAYSIALDPEAQKAGGNLSVEDLERLAQLRERGLLTDEEFSAAKAKLLAGGAEPGKPVARKPNLLEGGAKESVCGRLIDRSFSAAEMAKLVSSGREITTARDGTDRQVVVSCAWEIIAPVPATLKVSVACGDEPADLIALCAPSGGPPANDNPACVWGSDSHARAAVQAGCAMEGTILYDPRRVNASNSLVSPLDVREILRAMAGRI